MLLTQEYPSAHRRHDDVDLCLRGRRITDRVGDLLTSCNKTRSGRVMGQDRMTLQRDDWATIALSASVVKGADTRTT